MGRGCGASVLVGLGGVVGVFDARPETYMPWVGDRRTGRSRGSLVHVSIDERGPGGSLIVRSWRWLRRCRQRQLRRLVTPWGCQPMGASVHYGQGRRH